LWPHYEEKWAHVAIFRQWVVLACHQHVLEFLNFSFFHLTCSKIWLSPLFRLLPTHLPHEFGKKNTTLSHDVS
jgi:hypothetical protein